MENIPITAHLFTQWIKDFETDSSEANNGEMEGANTISVKSLLTNIFDRCASCLLGNA
jgi:hypothetical protein